MGEAPTTYLKPDGDVVSKAINTIWTHQTAKRVRSWGTTTANLTGTASTRTLTAVAGGNWRETLVKNTFDDATGLETQIDDQGDTSTAADDRCTKTDYASDTTSWMLNFPSRVETVAVKCGASVNRPDQVVSDARSYYDNGAFDAAPSKGNVTKEEKIADYDGGTPHYVTSTATTYDSYGRAQTVTDAAGHTTTTAYTPTTGLPTVATVTGPPVKPGDTTTAMTTITDLDPAWNLPITTIDAGGKRNDMDYDALGRLTKVWLANTSKAAGNVPNMAYVYMITKDAAVAVQTKTILPDDSTTTSYQIFDGLLRPRQTQAPGPNGGRLITDALYNSLGKTDRTYAAYYASGAPDHGLFGIDQPGDVESQTAYDYDGLGRVTTERLLTGNGAGTEKWRTTTAYAGDRVSVDPPNGGTPTTTIADARGNVTEVRQYKGDTPSGDYDATTYTYTPAGKPDTVVDAAGNTWTHTYDLRGREIQTGDPDKGLSKTSYDDLDRVTSTEDARGKKIFFSYDPIGRKTEEREDSTTGTLLTSWVYDTVRKGQLTSITRNINDANYVTTNNAYDNLNQPIRTTYTVPSVKGEEKLAGSYQYNTHYNLDNTVQSTGFPLVPQVAGMAAEGVVYDYDDLRRPTTTSGTSSYVTNTLYSLTGKPEQYELSTGGKKAWLTYSYEYGTQRLAESRTERENIAGVDRDAKYGYDDAGNLKSITDTSRAGTDTQCFSYDYLARLAEAWTPTSGCDAAPAKNLLGGPAPYWTSYKYDVTGNRTSETDHGTSSVATDTTRTYDYPDPGNGQHQLASVSQTGAAGNRTGSFGYDADGNTTSRQIGTAGQSLTWDNEGHLATTVDSTGTTSYAYDANGSRILRRDPKSTTLYLPNMELRLDKTTNTVSGTRYYTHNGTAVAMRTASGVQFLSADPHGSADLAIDASSQNESQRHFTPFGELRGSPTGIWPNDKGFVGGTIDPDGLTHLGAREYDADTGRFISVDPVFDPQDQQSWNGYAYADNNPTTKSDPSGLMVPCDSGHGGCGLTGHLPGTQPKSSNSGRGSGCLDPTCGSTNMGRNNSYGISTPHLVQISPHVSIASNDPKLAELQWFWKYASKHSPDLDEAAKWQQICQGGDSPCNYRLKSLFLEHNMDWLNPSPARSLISSGGNIVLADSPYGEVPIEFAPCNSFTSGTRVELANGKYKAIEKLKVGDRVASLDLKTNLISGKKVVATFSGGNYDHLVKITVRQGRQLRTIVATEHHKFWSQTRRAWVRADQLTAGSGLRSADKRPVRVVRAARFQGHPDVYDLTIAGYHTFYVRVGEASVLVHNSSGCSISMDDAVARAADFVQGEGRVGVSGSGAYQFIRSYVDSEGNTVTQIARLDINPTSPHVQKYGPHLNLETQINGDPVRTGPLADPHIAIDLNDLRPGDIPEAPEAPEIVP